jgi:hypothetical protein
MRELMKNNDLSQCPGCETAVSKMEACNCMKCFCGVAHCYLCQDRWRSECEDHKWDLRQKQTTEDDLFDEAGENAKKRAETQATAHFEVHGKSTGFEQNWRTAF